MVVMWTLNSSVFPVCVFQLEENELRGVALLVFANKQDLPRAMSVGDITEALRLSGASQPVGAHGSVQVGECFLTERPF